MNVYVVCAPHLPAFQRFTESIGRDARVIRYKDRFSLRGQKEPIVVLLAGYLDSITDETKTALQEEIFSRNARVLIESTNRVI